jgi:HEAT repeat protein
LLLAARDWEPGIQCAAVSSLGWSQPQDELGVTQLLQHVRADSNADVRRAAESALARLGERRALQNFRAALAGETENAVDETIRAIARERILWLWPDLDALADSDDGHVAMSARESLERMREGVAGESFCDND